MQASYPLRCKSILSSLSKTANTAVFLLKNFTNFWRGNKVLGIDSGNSDKEAHVDLLHQSNVALLFEGTLESAPQFVIQPYAMVVQQESVTIVQMVSLPVSFLSLAWASTVGDELIHSLQ